MPVRFFLKRVLPIAVLVWAVFVCTTFALRHGEEPVRADAVVVLQGSKTRLPEGLKLVREGYAPLLVVSQREAGQYSDGVCAPRQKVVRVRVICFVPKPFSTRGEARFVGRLAQERGLDRIDVITSQFHVFRAGIVLRRCYHDDLRMVGAPQPWWKLPLYAVKESAKLAYQVSLARDC